ncbi:MAG: hypothetical protein ACXWWG_00640 [Nitrospira sp.]
MAKSTALATTTADDAKSKLLAAYGGEEGENGYENVSGADLSLPFLSVLQGISPEVTDNNPDGARAGMLMNTITKELYDGEAGVVFQPTYHETKYVEWVPREKGGGWVAAYDPTDPEVRAAQVYSASRDLPYGKLETQSGNTLVETVYFYGNVLDEKGETVNGFAVLSCSSMKIKPARAFLTVMRTTLKGKIPLWGWRTRVVTVKEKNDKGTFHNIQFKPLVGNNWLEGAILPDDRLYAEGKALREMVQSGKAKVDHAQQGAPAASGRSGADDSIPF